MLEDLERLRPGDRPRSISTWMIATPHLRTWCTARWLVALLIPVLSAVISSVVRRQPPIASIVYALGGMGIAFWLFATIASGVESTNWGTFFRRREPVQFWIGVLVTTTAYVLICVAGLAMNAVSPASAVNAPAPASDAPAESK